MYSFPTIQPDMMNLYDIYTKKKRFHGASEGKESACNAEDPSMYVCMRVLVAQSCLTLFNPINCSPPGSAVHGILQARILEWVAIPFSSMCIYIYIYI